MFKAALSFFVLLTAALLISSPGASKRGGSWLDPSNLYRLAKRFAFAPQGRRDFLGFRVVMKVKR